MTNFSPYIEHTQLSPTASETDIRKLCEEAWIHQFSAVCVAPSYVAYTVEMFEFCPVKIEIATVIGFPFGFSTTGTKVFEAETALRDGATELNVTMNMSQFKSMAYLSIREELKQLAELAHAHQAVLKVYMDASHLDSFDLYNACEICSEAKVDYVATSADHVGIAVINKLRSILPSEIKIMAFGDVKTAQEAEALTLAGAERIGTPGMALIGNR